MPVTKTRDLPGASYQAIKLVKGECRPQTVTGSADTNQFPTIKACNTSTQTHANKNTASNNMNYLKTVTAALRQKHYGTKEKSVIARPKPWGIVFPGCYPQVAVEELWKLYTAKEKQ